MTGVTRFFAQYIAALNRYLDLADDEALPQEAILDDLAKLAASERLGVTKLLDTHGEAMSCLLSEEVCGQDLPRQVKRGTRFLKEVIDSFQKHTDPDAPTRLLHGLYEVMEEEAARFAHILHDESAQILALAYMEIAEFAREVPDSLSPRVTRIIACLDDVREQLRGLSHELRPVILDELGLAPALHQLANGTEKRSNIKVIFGNDFTQRLPPRVESVLYRVVQEALSNAAKHSGADTVTIELAYDEQNVHCTVHDNGCGFDQFVGRGKGGLGLVGMKERVRSVDGEISIESAPGKGTRIKVDILL